MSGSCSSSSLPGGAEAGLMGLPVPPSLSEVVGTAPGAVGNPTMTTMQTSRRGQDINEK